MGRTADASGIWRETSDASGHREGHPPMVQSLKERLLAVRYVREAWDEPYGTYSQPCDADDHGAEAVHINPDGPEAVQEIERLEAGVARIANRMIKPGASRGEIQAMCAALLKSQEQNDV